MLIGLAFSLAVISLILHNTRSIITFKSYLAILQALKAQGSTNTNAFKAKTIFEFRWLLNNFLCDAKPENDALADITNDAPNAPRDSAKQSLANHSTSVNIMPLTFQYRNGYVLRGVSATQRIVASKDTLSFIPALLTSLGIIGTFIGIVSGLGDVSLDAQSDALLNDVKKLFGGMTTAFQTSLAGLGLSAVYMIINASHQRHIGSLNKRFEQELDAMSLVVNPIYFLKGLDPDKQKEALEVQKAVGEQLKSLVSGFDSKAMGAAIGENIRNVMQEDFTPAFTAMATELSELNRSNKNNNKELIDLLTQSLKDEIIAPIAAQISNIASAVEKTNNSIETLSTELDKVVDNLSSTVKRLTEFQTQTLNDLSAFASNLQGILKDFEQTMSVAMRETAKSSSEMIIAASRELQSGLGDIDKKINMIKNTLQTELETFRLDYQKNLNSFFIQQNTNLDKVFDNQKDGLEQVINRFKQTFENDLSQRAKITEELVQSAQIVQRLSRDINMLQDAELGHLVDAIGKNQQAVNDINKASQDAYNHIEQSVSKFSDYVDMFFEKNVKSTTEFFTQLDDASSKIVRTLLAGAAAQISADRLRDASEEPSAGVDK